MFGGNGSVFGGFRHYSLFFGGLGLGFRFFVVDGGASSARVGVGVARLWVGPARVEVGRGSRFGRVFLRFGGGFSPSVRFSGAKTGFLHRFGGGSGKQARMVSPEGSYSDVVSCGFFGNSDVLSCGAAAGSDVVSCGASPASGGSPFVLATALGLRVRFFPSSCFALLVFSSFFRYSCMASSMRMVI